MRHPHVVSGGRYPVLRAVAILFMISGIGIFIYGIYQAIAVMTRAPDDVTGRAQVAVYWVAGAFLSTLVAIAMAELMKLLMDIEYNTRRTAHHTAPAGQATGAEAEAGRNGPGVPLIAGDGKQKWMDGDETAEGALIRGH